METDNAKKHWGRGRRKPKELVNRTKRFEIRLTAEEFNRLKSEAEEYGHSPTQYVRKRIFKREVAVINAVEFLSQYRERNRQLNKIGNNINQLARYANYVENSGKVSPAIIEELNSCLREFVRCQRETADLNRRILKSY